MLITSKQVIISQSKYAHCYLAVALWEILEPMDLSLSC